MLVAETCLLIAVRNTLRTALTLGDKQCEINLDDQVFALAKDLYVSINAAGTTPGERHRTSGGVWDYRFSVRVTVYQKITEIARDKRRDQFAERLIGLNAKLDQVIAACDFNYTSVVAAANALLVGTAAEGGNYPEPFRSFSIDPAPRTVHADPYAAANNPAAPMADPTLALARGVTFRDARFMKVRA